MAVEPTYTSEKVCPICDNTFPATITRSRLTMTSQDSDFCTYYKEVNPNYYAVWVCPQCGYAALDTYFQEQNPAAVEKIRTFLQGRTVNVNFGGIRTREQAIATYKLAIFYADLSNSLKSRIGALYLRLAWLYRDGQQEAEEQAALDKARDYYEQAMLRERTPIGNMSQFTLEYLIGELLRRTGNLDQALSYMGKVAGDPLAKNEYKIWKMAKESWQQIREAKKKLLEAEKDAAE